MKILLKLIIMFLSFGIVINAPIKRDKIIDPFIAYLPERPYFQIDNNIYIVPPNNQDYNKPVKVPKRINPILLPGAGTLLFDEPF
jgi:hypothetical protein